MILFVGPCHGTASSFAGDRCPFSAVEEVFDLIRALQSLCSMEYFAKIHPLRKVAVFER